ncbi:hypothetical protein [Roseibium sp. SCP14]|uniref:hypothetical protein n=1 Tax=Roseibium sp. SCP14 TaxID=3141375 RepID=UPI00333A066A
MGIRTNNLSPSASVDEVVGHVDLDGEKSLAVVPVSKLAAQMEAKRGPKFELQSELFADLDWVEGSEARVWGDPTLENRGVYTKSGAPGTGAWTRIGPIPETDVSHALRVPEDEFVTPFPDAATRAGTVPIFDEEGNPKAGPTAADIANAQTNASDAQIARNEAVAAASGLHVPTYDTLDDVSNIDVPQGRNRFEVGGHSTEGDKGNGRYGREASEPSHPAKKQDQSGAWFALREPRVRLQHLGGVADSIDPYLFHDADSYLAARAALNGGAGPTDNAAAWQEAILTAYALKIPVEIDGHFYVSEGAYMPKGTGGEAFSRDDGMVVYGAGHSSKHNSIATGGKAVLYQEGLDFNPDGSLDPGSSIGTQHVGHTVKHFTVVGACDFETHCNGIILANTRTCEVSDIRGYGFARGAPVTIFGFSKGGSFGAHITKVISGHDAWEPGTQNRSFAMMAYNSCRWGVRLLTREHDIGKVNDPEVYAIHCNNALECAISTRPADFGGAGSTNYGPGNIRVYGGFVFAEPVRKFRTGTLTQGGDNLNWILAFDGAPPDENLAPGGNVQCVLRAEADGRIQYREITAHEQGTGTVTIGSAFNTADPADGSDFRVMLTTDEIVADNNSRATYPRAMDFHSNENILLSGLNVEEVECPFVVPDEVRRVTGVACRIKVTDGVYFLKEDGTPADRHIRWVGDGDTINFGNAKVNEVIPGLILHGGDDKITNQSFTGDVEFVKFDGFDTITQVRNGMCIVQNAAAEKDDFGWPGHRGSTGNNLDFPRLVIDPTDSVANPVWMGPGYVPVGKSGSRGEAMVAETEVVNLDDTLASAPGGIWRKADPTDTFKDAPLQACSAHDGSPDPSGFVWIKVRVRAG